MTPRYRLLALLALALAVPPACDGVSEDPSNAHLRFRAAESEVATWDFGENILGSAASWVTITISNDGEEPTGALSIGLDGDVDHFSMMEDSSTCAGASLAPGRACAVRLRFQPTGTGALQAELVVDAPNLDRIVLPLLGNSRKAWLSSPATLAVGIVEMGTSAYREVVVRNESPMALGGMTTIVEGPGAVIASTTCTGTLAPQGTCSVSVRVTPTGVGPVTAHVRVSSGTETTTTALSSTGARRITLHNVGNGHGKVVSNPPGIECGDTCTGLFATTVELQVIPDPGSDADTWASGPCAGTKANPCTVPLADNHVDAGAQLTFPPTRSITLRVEGEVPGEIEYAFNKFCADECTVEVPNGSRFRATAFSPGRIVSIDGPACDTASCSFDAHQNATIAVTFGHDERVTRTKLLEDSSRDTRVTFFRELPVTWSTSSKNSNIVRHWPTDWAYVRYSSKSASIIDLLVTRAGDFYAFDGEMVSEGFRIEKFPIHNATQWTKEVQGSVDPAKQVALRPGGGIVLVMRTGSGVDMRAYAADGKSLWTCSQENLSGGTVRGIAVGPDATTHVLMARDTGAGKIARCSDAGEALAPIDIPSLATPRGIAVDSRGRIAIATPRGIHVLSRDGALQYEVTSGDVRTFSLRGALLAVGPHDELVLASATLIEKVSADGNLVWRVPSKGTRKNDLAIGPDGTIAITGNVNNLSRGYLSLLAP